jgi:hypothetical protein
MSIYHLRIKIDDQQSVLSRFPCAGDFYVDEFVDRKRKGGRVNDYVAAAVFSERFRTKSDVDMDNARYNRICYALADIEQKMRDEIDRHRGILEQQESDLRNANGRIAQLRIDHANALRAEEDERQRASSQQRCRY